MMNEFLRNPPFNGRTASCPSSDGRVPRGPLPSPQPHHHCRLWFDAGAIEQVHNDDDGHDDYHYCQHYEWRFVSNVSLIFGFQSKLNFWNFTYFLLENKLFWITPCLVFLWLSLIMETVFFSFSLIFFGNYDSRQVIIMRQKVLRITITCLVMPLFRAATYSWGILLQFYCLEVNRI